MYRLYVGSPNEIHKIDQTTLSQIKDIIARYFESYTYIKAHGVYKDTEEDMLLITIADAKRSDVYKLGEKLCVYLKQDAVAIEHNGKYERLITR